MEINTLFIHQLMNILIIPTFLAITNHGSINIHNIRLQFFWVFTVE